MQKEFKMSFKIAGIQKEFIFVQKEFTEIIQNINSMFSKRLQNVFKKHFQKVFQKNSQQIFKKNSQQIFQKNSEGI